MLGLIVINRLRQLKAMLRHYGAILAVSLVALLILGDAFIGQFTLPQAYPRDVLVGAICLLSVYIALIRRYPLLLINPASILFARGTRVTLFVCIFKIAWLVVGYGLLSGFAVVLGQGSLSAWDGLGLVALLCCASVIGWWNYHENISWLLCALLVLVLCCAAAFAPMCGLGCVRNRAAASTF